jgi:hypothetical protein
VPEIRVSRLRFLIRAWVRYHGWRNVYWREDAYKAACSHDHLYFDETGALCMDCGGGYWTWDGLTFTSNSTTTRYKVFVR